MGREYKFKMKTQPNRIGPLSNEQIKDLGLEKVWKKLSAKADRDVNFVLYENTIDVFKRHSVWMK